jgi:hypothetical protein
MQSKHAILEVLFPVVRAKLLRVLLAPPLKQRYVRELMNQSGLALHTVQDELRKLSALGLVGSWSNGYHRFYRADPAHPLFAPLRRIVAISAELPSPKRSAIRRPESTGLRKRPRRASSPPKRIERRPQSRR